MMLTAKKMLRFLLCAQMIMSCNYIIPAAYEPQSVVDIAHLTAKLKTLINFMYDTTEPEDHTEELDAIYSIKFFCMIYLL